MTRLEKVAVEALTHDQRALYDSIARGPRAQGPQAFALTDAAGGLEGPFNAMLISPAIGAALQEVGTAVRYGTDLSDRVREIAILLVAHHWQSDFEIYAHEAVGRLAGLSDAELDSLRTGRVADFADPIEGLAARTVQALALRNDLDDNEYADAETGLGAERLLQLTTIVGYYATLALQLRVYRVSVPTS